MKRVALAMFTATYALIASITGDAGFHPITAYADSNQGDSKNSDTNNLLNSLFGSGSDNVAGSTPAASTPAAKPKTPAKKTTHPAAHAVVDDAYSTVLSDWHQQGLADATSFSQVIHPQQFESTGGTLSLTHRDDYAEPVFDWSSQLQGIRFHVNVPQDGLYVLKVDYRSTTSRLAPIERGVLVNGEYQYFESRSIVFHTLWKNASEQFSQDEQGNEPPPDQVQVFDWQSQYMMDSSYLSDDPLRFHLHKGDNTIELTQVSEGLQVGNITVESPSQAPDYKAYLSAHQETPVAKTLDTYEAEHPLVKSDPYIQAQSSANPGVTPYRPGKITLNTLGDTTWKNGGQSVTWKINVSQTGFYHLAYKYMQATQINLPVYRTLSIDGVEPFQEAKRIAFPYASTWKNETLGDKSGQPYAFWLTKGTHELTLTADPAPFEPVIKSVHQVMQSINAMSLKIRKATGNTLDQNRDWDINAVVPGIVPQLRGYAKTLQSAFNTLSVMSGQRADAVRSIAISADRLNSLADHPEKIPYLYTDLAQGAGSINEQLGTLLQTLPDQPLLLDKFYVYSGDQSLPSPDAGFFRTLFANIGNFFGSFFHDASVVGSSDDKNAVTVWVNRPRQYVMLMQEMADHTFTKQTGIKVSLALMPNEQKLTLSNAAGQTPDVALSVDNATPFNMGLRGAVQDLSTFPDYPEVEKRFSPGAMLPFQFNGHVYGIPNTQDFWVLFYRKDILDNLKIKVPQTWDDVLSILPTLQRYGMNFYDPIAGAGAYKSFYTVVPFLYQHGGALYRPDGMHAALDSDANLAGFKQMTKLFTVYGLPLQVPNFYSHFRQGDLPIGIANFNTYVQLSSAAPELNGLWSIAPIPGVRDMSGTIERYAPGTGDADMIFKNSTKKDQAWAFLKWWTSEKTQADFGQKVETIYGPAFRWNSSNLAAFGQLPWPEHDIQVISEQWKWLKDVPHIPGDYMVERGLSDAWNKVVFNGENARLAMDDAELNANREIRVQLEQLGYIAPSGNVLKKIQLPNLAHENP